MKVNKPKLDTNTLLPIAARQLTTEAKVEKAIIANVDLTGLSAKNMSFDEACLEKVTLIETMIEKLTLTDVLVKSCELSAAHCSESSFIRTRFVAGRMEGIDISRCTIKDVVFTDCKLDLANVRFSKLTRVQFINCTMSEIDFQGSELNEVTFQNCHLEKAEFAGCKVKAVDFRSSVLLAIRGWQSLKGALIDSTQLISIAQQLAAELGLMIAND